VTRRRITLGSAAPSGPQQAALGQALQVIEWLWRQPPTHYSELKTDVRKFIALGRPKCFPLSRTGYPPALGDNAWDKVPTYQVCIFVRYTTFRLFPA